MSQASKVDYKTVKCKSILAKKILNRRDGVVVIASTSSSVDSRILTIGSALVGGGASNHS